MLVDDTDAPAAREHTHHCPVCGQVWSCVEGGWHEIDYRWHVSCEACRARGLRPPANAPVTP